MYLSSQGLGDSPELLRHLNPEATHALIILNALDPYPSARQGAFINESTGLSALGYECQELDLRHYFQSDAGARSELTEHLRKTDLVWVAGGNTFVLARAMQQSSFKSALLQANLELEIAQSPSLIYGGYSAGAVVVGPDLQGIHLMDDRRVIPAGYQQDTEALTLGFIDDRIVPHYQSDNPESGHAQKAVDYLEHRKLKYRTMSDGDTWITHTGKQ